MVAWLLERLAEKGRHLGHESSALKPQEGCCILAILKSDTWE